MCVRIKSLNLYPNADLDGEPEDKSQRSESPAKRTSSALDNLMGSKSKATSRDSTKKTPASLDEFMAKVSTASQPQVKSGELHAQVLARNLSLLCYGASAILVLFLH